MLKPKEQSNPAQTWLKCPLRDHPVDLGAQPRANPAYIPAHGSTEEEWQRGFHGVRLSGFEPQLHNLWLYDLGQVT